jgi:hypothetical protein
LAARMRCCKRSVTSETDGFCISTVLGNAQQIFSHCKEAVCWYILTVLLAFDWRDELRWLHWQWHLQGVGYNTYISWQ